ncbi:hypothetical protein CKM354_001106500 [Cercospora kikuchii]|uniref:DUF7704 domain-containing protein n=1 Tax=Cercospora kikuchii TaxID=84275 RepID=A0A9P3CWE0_9PEZI|nr:uncharacterized protein CKM354_001106500 [Cercospora kikuchii]GIZ47990.1 hypothetical protein CKM354_001106500 [Cercospora kikuchii]
MPSPLPKPYTLFFTLLDPLIALSGIYMMFFTPAVVTDAFVPSTLSPYYPLQTFFQHQLGGALLMCVILQLFLLRRTQEVWIWKTVQAGQLVYDFALLYSIFNALSQQGRLHPKVYRPEDWGNIVIVGICAVVRGLFCVGVGVERERKEKKRE